MIRRPFPEEHVVPSLQLLCASHFDTSTLDKYNLSHLHLPPVNYVPTDLILLGFNKSIIMYTCDYNNLVNKYANLLINKTNYSEVCTMINLLETIKPATCSERYKKYLFERIGVFDFDRAGEIYLPAAVDKSFVVLQNDKTIEFLRNFRDMMSIIYYVAELIRSAPFMNKRMVHEYVDKCKTIDLKKYIDYFYIALERLCYENGIVTNWLIIYNILPLTMRTIIYHLAPKEFSVIKPDLKQDVSFVPDPYLPCKCLKANELIMLRREF
jgi:hypothetical protein